MAINEKEYPDTQENSFYIETVYSIPEDIKRSLDVIDSNSTSAGEEKKLEVSLCTETLLRSSFLENRFELVESFFGYIDSVDKESLSFTIIVNDNSENTYEMYLSYQDVDSSDIDKIRVGANLVVLYGYEYKNGTARKRTKIVFRTVTKWNKSKLKLYKGSFESRK